MYLLLRRRAGAPDDNLIRDTKRFLTYRNNNNKDEDDIAHGQRRKRISCHRSH